MKQLWLKAGVKMAGRWMIPSVPFREAYFYEDALQFRKALKLPLVYVGGLVSREKIDMVLDSGFECVAMARALINEPDFVNRMKERGELRCGCEHTNYCIARMYSVEMPATDTCKGCRNACNTKSNESPHDDERTATPDAPGPGHRGEFRNRLPIRPAARRKRLRPAARKQRGATDRRSGAGTPSAVRGTGRRLCRDLSLADAADSLFEYTRQQGFEVEVLVNNAGVFFFDDLTETDSRRIERMIGLHVQTVTMLCRYFGAAMKARGKGYILNMSSMSAGMPFPGISVYAATKSYLKQFSKAIHNELYDYGVRVTAVCPGAVATDLYNLSGHYQRLGLRLGILMRPERLARKGLRALFAGRRCVTPGAVNHLFMPLAALVPSRLIRLIKRRAKFYRYGR